MSAGTIHRKASIILAIVLFIQGVLMWDIGGLARTMGALLGIVSTPDWDVDAGMIMDKTIRTRIGKWAEVIWDGFLYWYRRSLKHGSPLSHFPIISTIGRIIYVYLWVIVIPHSIIKIIFSPAWDFMDVMIWYAQQIMAQENLIFGLMASDFIHWGLDISTTEHASKKKKTKK